MNKLSTPSLTASSNILRISNIDPNASQFQLKKNGETYKTLFPINDTYTNVTASVHYGMISNNDIIIIDITADGSIYKVPLLSPTVYGATGTYVRHSDISATLTLSTPVSAVSFSVIGERIKTGYVLNVSSWTSQKGCVVNLTSSSGQQSIITSGEYEDIISIDSIVSEDTSVDIYEGTGISKALTLPYTLTADTTVYVYTSCVIGETPILMQDGTYKMIKNINIGDQIASINPDTGEQVVGVVSGIKIGKSISLVHMILTNGVSIKMTPTHPVLTSNGYKTYIGYGTDNTKLMVGDRVIGNEEDIFIEKLNYYKTAPTTVYALDVKLSNEKEYYSDISDGNTTIWLPYLTYDNQSESYTSHTG